MPLLNRRRILALAAESALGQAASLTNSNANFKVEERNLTIVRSTAYRQAQGSGGVDIGIAEDAHTELNLTAKWTGSSTTNVAALPGLLLPACGFVNSTGTFSRTWSSSNWASLSAGAFIDGRKKVGRGILGNLKWTFVPGKTVNVEATMKGAYVSTPTDTAILTGISYDSTLPAIWSPSSGTSGTNLTIDGNTFFKPGTVEIDLNNTISLREDPNSVGGYISAWISEGAARMTLDPEAVSAATYDFFAAQNTNDTFTASVVLNGGSNNTWTWSGTWQVTESPTWGDRNGRLVENIVLTEVNDSLTIAQS